MFKLLKMFLFCIVFSVFWSSTAAAVVAEWVGPNNGSWGDPDNWEYSDALVPDDWDGYVPNEYVHPNVTFDVTINTTERTGIRLDSPEIKIASLVCSGEIDFYHSQSSVGKLEITDSPLINNGKLIFSGEGAHKLTGSMVNNSEAELQLSNLLEVDGGDVTNDGQILIVGGDEHTGLTLNEGLLTNNGTINIFHASVISTDTGIINSSSGEIKGSGWLLGSGIQNQGLISATFGELSVISFTDVLSNSGTIKNAPGASVLVAYYSSEEAEVLNSGMIEVNAGGGVTFNAPLRNSATATIKLLDGVFAAANLIQSSGADTSGFGTLTGNILIESGGIIQLVGPTNIIGTLDIEATATLEIGDGQALIVGHTVNNGTVHLKSGGIGRFQGGLTDNGTIIHEDGSYYTQEELDQEIEVAISKYDPSLDGQVGLEEAIFALRTASGLVSP